MPLLQLSASAGSGKTHRLSREFVKLCLSASSIEAASGLIAMTFTNKATAEMKERILHLLYDLSQVNTLETLRHESLLYPIAKDQGIDAFKLKAHQVLRYLLKNYHLFSVSTIDSFFQKLISVFQRELQLMHELKIELDQDVILQKSVDHLVDHLQPKDEAFRWIQNWVESTMDDDKTWDFRRQLKQQGRDLFKEGIVESWGDETDWSALREANHQMSSFCKEVDESILQFIGTLKSILDTHGLAAIDFKNKGKGPISSFISCTGLSDIDAKTNLIERLVDESYWLPKDGLSVNVESQLADLFQLLESFYLKVKPRYYTYKAVFQNFYAYLALRFLHRSLVQVSRDEDVLLISESNRLVNQVINDADASLIYEKTGQRFQHLMVDEFQDTSAAQWENLVPLFENSLAEGQACLMVGDIKQAIYRFRNGDWRIMHEGVQKDLGQYDILIEHLENNWRSSKSIVDFNNYFFPTFIRHLKHLEEVNTIPLHYSNTLDLIYESVVQVPRKPIDFEGSVELFVLQREEASDLTEEEESTIAEPYFKWLNQVLNRAYQAGFSPSDIAILVRDNRESKVILTLLERLQQVNKKSEQFVGVAESGFLLRHSKLIRLLVEVLRLKSYPQNNHLVPCIEQYWQDLHPKKEVVYLLDKRLHQLPGPILIAIQSPIHTLTEWFLQTLSTWELASFEPHYVAAFLDLVRQFELNEGGDAELFLEWWDDKGVKRGLSAGSDQAAIQVMTIHKSKGLQFPIVILPFLANDMLIPKVGSYLYVKDSDDPILATLGSFPVNYSQKLLESTLSTFAIEEQFMHLVDNLNLLYVAFTRPEQQLIMGIDAPQKNKSGEIKNKRNTSNLLLSALGYLNENDPEPYYLLSGNPNCLKYIEKDKDKQSNERVSNPIHLDEISIRHHELSKGIWIEKPLQTSATLEQGAKRRGIIMHRILELIVNPRYLDAALELCMNEGLLDESDKKDMVDAMSQFFELEEVSDWFHPRWKVYKEHAIINVDGKVYRPDRVLISEHETLLIDYKTGAERREYVKQMERYKLLLHQMGLPHVRGILAFVDNLTLVHC